GMMMTALFMGYIAVQAKRHPEMLPPRGERPSLYFIVTQLLGIWPLVILIGAVLGSIYAGLATPTESAGLGALAAIILGAAFGEIRTSQLWQAARNTVASLGAIF